MESLGAYLKQERERRGISLSEIARVTKVNERQLGALEADQFDQLPPPPFVKGFIQAYAQVVGLDSQEVVRRYQEYRQAQQAAVVQDAPPPPKPPLWERKPLVWSALVVALLLYLVAVYTLDLFPQRARQPGPPPPVAPKSASPSAPQAPAGVAGEATPPASPGGPSEATTREPASPAPGSPPGAAAEAPGESNAAGGLAGTAGSTPPAPSAKVSLQARAVDRTWIWIQLDDREPREVLLRPGETARWQAEQRLVAIIGNAGGVEIQADGRDLGKLGPPGKVVKLTLPEGLPPAPGSPAR
ncbi:MAG: helix-turn-helix domain-containing protein [Deltaproteobacteria bacterium]|nr:helix-turn-helix domain-containing protein [Deltaproteobacteria bacterium]MBI3076732.1 helix-turn-helix domain-containing protein [Deltaproteobacteria bacterium]